MNAFSLTGHAVTLTHHLLRAVPLIHASMAGRTYLLCRPSLPWIIQVLTDL